MTSTPNYSKIQEIVNSTQSDSLPNLNVSVLRTIMVESIEPYVRYHALQMGHNAAVQFGEYDNVFQEAVGGRPDLMNDATDIVLVFMGLESLSWDLARNFTALKPEGVRNEIERVTRHMETILSGIRKQTSAMVIWHGLETPLYPALGVVDSQVENGQLAAVREINAHFRSVLAATPNAYFLDMDICRSFVGGRNFYDLRYWHIGRAPYTLAAVDAIAFEQAKFIRPQKGKNRKCLVLDCDNTIWGGIIGEDGINGIKLSKTYPGSSFFEFQQEIVSLHNRGVILALCSKNNEADVWEVFDNHPDMVLCRAHIATAQINWQDKAANLRQIALDLNIGLDSLVFMDDSDFEINLVREQLPEVEAVLMPKKTPVLYRDLLAGGGWFDTLTLSAEDKIRGAMYRAEADRKKLKAQTTDMKSYYASLEMEITIARANDFSIPRISQQTQKTNQFNLTTRRYSEADIAEFAADENSDVICLSLQDRFGDSGIVGTCVLQFNGGEALFDSFLLSCRVLGRDVEKVFLLQALQIAKDRGCIRAIGEYYATLKNVQVELFYGNEGFEELSQGSVGANKRFAYDLTGDLPDMPDFFKSITFSQE
ncbi:MAG: HAD family hydrolase [Pseudodesulfovibrio sp.]|nr:HAD family hydrolase [Pseudodesulfovibrio sp.]